MSNQTWVGVPPEAVDVWRKVFNTASVSQAMNLTASCPVCGASTLHRYYSLQKEAPRQLRGVSYRGPGSYWEWCSTCRCFEHMYGYVPVWWSVPPLDVDHSLLTPVPDLLEAARPKDGMG
jgi:hypothetical protein